MLSAWVVESSSTNILCCTFNVYSMDLVTLCFSTVGSHNEQSGAIQLTYLAVVLSTSVLRSL